MGSNINAAGLSQAGALPGWVPPGAVHYIAHTEKGQPIRALARQAGCHASTILRQIRKVEMRRDDPLVDAALRKLGELSAQGKPSVKAALAAKDQSDAAKVPPIPDDETLSREAMRVLRRLSESGAVLAVADGLDKAVVVRDAPSGSSARTAVVDTQVAQAMALKDWIAASSRGRIARYRITGAGRTALDAFLDRFGPPKGLSGFGEAPAAFDMDEDDFGGACRSRYAVGESPLSALARRKDKDGTPFLSDVLVHAGERLREDFELAQMDDDAPEDWDLMLSSPHKLQDPPAAGPASASAAARDRVQLALQTLGPGLSDVMLRCCCYLEGLESAEKRLGWSARSGKIVLRIALMRLKRHYDETVGPGGPMIG